VQRRGRPEHIDYQMNPAARVSSDRFVYEKALLDDWFRRIVGSRYGRN